MGLSAHCFIDSCVAALLAAGLSLKFTYIAKPCFFKLKERLCGGKVFNAAVDSENAMSRCSIKSQGVKHSYCWAAVLM